MHLLVLKMMFLMFFDNVISERDFMRQLPMRLDWMWFLGFDLDTPTPNHSILSKARQRWGEPLFAEFFDRVLSLCVDANLAGGETVHADSTLLRACYVLLL